MTTKMCLIIAEAFIFYKKLRCKINTSAMYLFLGATGYIGSHRIIYLIQHVTI